MGFFEIYVRDEFSSAHSLREYEGNCARIHGHNWSVEVCIKCEELNKIGIGVDFRDLKKVLKEITGKLDHLYLNDLPEFKEVNPTAENIAKFIYGELKMKLKAKGVQLSKVSTSESASTRACYSEE